ncbi:MAG: M28 family peptidase [Phycisphaeraceae bacterium]|nr:M28 family peptidase [Phycisphaeraceae bacterium]
MLLPALLLGVLPHAVFPAVDPVPGVAEHLARVSAERIRADIDILSSFHTRHSLSDPDPEGVGIGAARQWILHRFQEAGGRLKPSFDGHSVPPGRRIPRETELVNVLAVLPGTMPQAAPRHVYVIAHYDSRASDPMDARSAAPGANDDGSGTVLVLELARVLAEVSLDCTVVFMATAGEEQGLLGARAHARAAHAEGRSIVGVLSNDIVGDPTGPGGREDRRHIRLFSEGIESNLVQVGTRGDDPRELEGRLRALGQVRAIGNEHDAPSRGLARYVAEVAAREQTAVQPRLVFRPDRFLRGGDHSAFNEFGFAAVRFTEVYENYDRQHQDIRVRNDRPYGTYLSM